MRESASPGLTAVVATIFEKQIIALENISSPTASPNSSSANEAYGINC